MWPIPPQAEHFLAVDLGVLGLGGPAVVVGRALRGVEGWAAVEVSLRFLVGEESGLLVRLIGMKWSVVWESDYM
jgi:hypothetical protein